MNLPVLKCKAKSIFIQNYPPSVYCVSNDLFLLFHVRGKSRFLHFRQNNIFNIDHKKSFFTLIIDLLKNLNNAINQIGN